MRRSLTIAGMDPIAALCRFLDDAPCPSFAADALEGLLEAQGFASLAMDASWPCGPGRFRVRRGDSLVAFVLRAQRPQRFHLVGAHTDSPHLRLKPVPARIAEGCLLLTVEVYGGALWNSWLDRDLGLAGTLHTTDGTAHRVRLDRPFARIPQLAIHLDRKVNDEGLKLNAQTHLIPIWGLAGDGVDAVAKLDAVLAAAAGISASDIVSRDLSLYDCTRATRGGAEQEFLFAARLDNLVSCQAGALALSAAADGDATTVPVLACFDHEEVGSASDTGADGAFLAQVLERITLAAGLDRSAHLAALAGSQALSADMAHAVHPAYVDRHDATHQPRLGHGPVIKSNVNQRYATSAASAARLRRLARREHIAIQDFASRNDLGCGSTIGPAVAAHLGMAVVDVGLPMLSMHAAREWMAVADHDPYIKLLAAHLRG